ncbi:MAG: DUF1189 family protein, partial [Pseudomonadota bacterium]
TRDSIIIKNNRQTRIVPLNKEMNLVINAGTLTQLKKTYFPTVVTIVTGAAGVYFLLAKLLQALLMALVPYVVGERSSEPLSYGNSIKIAVFCMLPPVMLDMFFWFKFPWPGLITPFVVYWVVYIALLALASWTLLNGRRRVSDPADPVQP